MSGPTEGTEVHVRRPALQSGGRAGDSHLSGEGEKGADLIVIQEQMWTIDRRMREILNLSVVPETGALSGTSRTSLMD